MAEKDQSGFSLDPKTAFLILALMGGGAYFFSKPLQSSRPSVSEAIGRTALGDQVIPARLWQDPFGVAMAYRKKRRQEADAVEPSAREGSRTNLTRDSIAETAQQIVRHANQTGRQPTITILEVMLSGGSYAEDTETRLRGRYAVLSALGVAGFVPWDAEHIGFAEVNWPRGRDLEGCSELNIPALPNVKSPGNSHLVLPYEWFIPNQEKPPANSNHVLVLWLNADAFADHPLKRLAQLNHLLGAEVTSAARSGPTNLTLKFKLINPSLYSLLHESFTAKGETKSDATIQLTNILSNLTLFSSWATTADALLVQDADGIRGAGVTNSIWAHGPSLVNVTCTDDQLIEELIDELALRGVHPENGLDAVAVLSEWDTFYGRALPITFAAVVKWRMNDSFTANSFLNLPDLVVLLNSPGKPYAYLSTQLSRNTLNLLTKADPNQAKIALAADLNRFLETDLKPELVAEQFGSYPSATFLTNHLGPVPKGKQKHLNRLLLEQAFEKVIATNQLSAAVQELRTNPAAWPTNILHFTYLRGVDGKTPGDADAEPKADTGNAEKTDDGHTKPEAPRAEGHSQMDYMPRQARRLAHLESALERNSNFKFKAVGILGSDVYDKLLVLQALRPMFHDELFFTTDMDARLLHPAELDWTRNLIVASSFGLQLSPDLQSDVPPFRDTYQTGTYLACLVAMDFPAAVANLGSLLPRRYEIGRAGAMDISICDSRIQRPLPNSKLLVFLKDRQNVFCLLLAGGALIVLIGLLSRSGLAGLARVRSVLWRGPNESKPPTPFAELPWWGFRLALLAPAVLVGVFLALMVLDQYNRQGEPFVPQPGDQHLAHRSPENGRGLPQLLFPVQSAGGLKRQQE